jgi:hypothetical protein
VPCQIALTVAIDVETSRHASTLNGRLPHRGVDHPTLPGNIAREPDIQRQQARHHATPSVCEAIKRTASPDLRIPMFLILFRTGRRQRFGSPLAPASLSSLFCPLVTCRDTVKVLVPISPFELGLVQLFDIAYLHRFGHVETVDEFTYPGANKAACYAARFSRDDSVRTKS